MSITKIVTHAGTFHADEVSAVALLQLVFPFTPVERTYTPSDEDFNNPSVVVLDVGRRYEPELNNYDHHQDANLPASNMLLLNNLVELCGDQVPFIWIGADTKLMLDLNTRGVFAERFFEYISNVDTGAIVENEYGRISPPTISGIIRSCNSLPDGFDMALGIMINSVRAYFADAAARVEAIDQWFELEILRGTRGGIAIHDSDEVLVGWQDLAIDSGVVFLVNRNKRGGYQVTSRDARKFPIPSHPSQTFLHNSRFCATYPTLEAAVDHLMTEKF